MPTQLAFRREQREDAGSFARLQEVSIFLFDKRSVEKLHKPKRRETVTDILRAGAARMERYSHPKLLQVRARAPGIRELTRAVSADYAYIAVRAFSRATP